MADSCFASQSSTTLKLSTSSIFDSHSLSASLSHSLSLPFSPLPPSPRVLKASNTHDQIRRSSQVKALYSDGFGTRTNAQRSGIWSIRDDLLDPSSPDCSVDDEGGAMGSFESVISQLSQYRVVRCSGEVQNRMAKVVVSQLLYLDAVDPKKDIIMYVNSPGGSVTAGMAIFDTMNHIRPDVSTVCVGLAASMGAFLLSAGTKGKRYCLPNSRIMIHQPMFCVEGTQSDIDVQVNEMLFHKASLAGYLAYHTGQSLEKIYQDIEHDYFMSAKEAKDYGLIDGVIMNPLKALQPLAAATAEQSS